MPQRRPGMSLARRRTRRRRTCRTGSRRTRPLTRKRKPPRRRPRLLPLLPLARFRTRQAGNRAVGAAPASLCEAGKAQARRIRPTPCQPQPQPQNQRRCHSQRRLPMPQTRRLPCPCRSRRPSPASICRSATHSAAPCAITGCRPAPGKRPKSGLPPRKLPRKLQAALCQSLPPMSLVPMAATASVAAAVAPDQAPRPSRTRPAMPCHCRTHRSFRKSPA